MNKISKKLDLNRGW